MTSTRTHWQAAARPIRPNVPLVLVADPMQRSPLRGRRLRLGDLVLARSRGFSLDARLAAGSGADSERLLAVRARMLVTPASRERLARDWAHLAHTARLRTAAAPPAPLCRDRVLAAEAEINELERALRVGLPVPARGVAMARHLLEDAASPLYNRRSTVNLRAALQAAVAALDPWSGLLTPSAG